jgi:hypothetical protein
MPVVDYAIDDLFVIRTVKALSANPDNRWANTYEVRAITAGDASELLALASKLVLFERLLHYAATQFVNLTVSTWEADSVPYNPANFISSALSSFGTRSTTGDGAPLSTCLSVARVPPTGRLGHLFYRGVLVEGDISAPAGKAILPNMAAINDEIDQAVEDAELAEHLGAGAANLQIVMISKTGGTVRPVIGLIAVGVSQVPTDHAWFNRTVTP